MKIHWESQIRILREDPRDEKKLREILKVKQKEYEKAEDSEDIDRLVPEMETLQFVLCLVSRKIRMRKEKKVVGVEIFPHHLSIVQLLRFIRRLRSLGG